jgi:hypothetical protein
MKTWQVLGKILQTRLRKGGLLLAAALNANVTSWPSAPAAAELEHLAIIENIVRSWHL